MSSGYPLLFLRRIGIPTFVRNQMKELVCDRRHQVQEGNREETSTV
jgi:hypothetical protein